jgi:protein-tyrosine phosphatase
MVRSPSRWRRVVLSVLHWPPAVALRGVLRNALWTVRGARLRNPAVPSRVACVVFVCKGNICRSPFAAVLAARTLGAAGLGDVRSLSAGLWTKQSNAPPAAALEAARRRDLSLDGHVPRTLTAELVEDADMVLVVEPWQWDELRRRYPARHDRFFLLSHFEPDAASYGAFLHHHIVDPFGGTPEAFERCYARIDAAVGALVTAIGDASTARPQAPRPAGVIR